jgi:hypothetical protein
MLFEADRRALESHLAQALAVEPSALTCVEGSIEVGMGSTVAGLIACSSAGVGFAGRDLFRGEIVKAWPFGAISGIRFEDEAWGAILGFTAPEGPVALRRIARADVAVIQAALAAGAAPAPGPAAVPATPAAPAPTAPSPAPVPVAPGTLSSVAPTAPSPAPIPVTLGAPPPGGPTAPSAAPVPVVPEPAPPPGEITIEELLSGEVPTPASTPGALAPASAERRRTLRMEPVPGPWRCARCGGENEPALKRCSQCGAARGRATAVRPAVRPAVPRLLGQAPGHSGEVHELLTPVFKIGRAEEANLSLPFADLSRLHAVIERSANGFRIVDLGSANGTFVNGQLVNARKLRGGETIRFGDRHTFYFDLPAGDPPVASAGTEEPAAPGASRWFWLALGVMLAAALLGYLMTSR